MELEQNYPLSKDTELGLSAGTLSKADIERLGRQRPDAFRTSFAEIGFCFSLLASMFMAVNALLSFKFSRLLTHLPGIFHQWLRTDCSHLGNRTRHTARTTNMACKCLLTRRGCRSVAIFTSRRCLGQLSCFRLRSVLVCYLVAGVWI